MGKSREVKILLVERDAKVRGTLSRWLEEEGYDPVPASTVAEAWKILLNEEVPVILCDVGLAQESGSGLLSKCRKQFPGTSVIVLADPDERREAIEALGLGADSYVIKLHDRLELLFYVRKSLERGRLVQLAQGLEQRVEVDVRKQTKEMRASCEALALRLAAAQEYRHSKASSHVRRIGLYAEAMTRELGRSAEHVQMMRLAAPLHDVGKIGIPDSIILKPGQLSPEEWVIVKSHTTVGSRILGGMSTPLLTLASDITLSHHERWDGTGYPNGLAGGNIPETARVVAILDVYDTLVHPCPYREALGEQEALDTVARERGQYFDPELYDRFLHALPRLRAIRERVPDTDAQ